MDQPIQLQEKLDIKLLILYVLRRLPTAIEAESLRQLCQTELGASYFDYSDCLSELVANGNVIEEKGSYRISEKGGRNIDAVESGLPYSLRSRANQLVAPVQQQLLRASMISARHETTNNGCTVFLSLSDGVGQVLRLELLCAGEEQAKSLEEHFRRDAEGCYQKIIGLLS